jgi:integrase
MGRPIHRLNDVQIKNWNNPGYLLDGGGLCLQVKKIKSVAKNPAKQSAEFSNPPKKDFTKSWCFRYRHRVTGKTVELGLGKYPAVSLKSARAKAEGYQTLLEKGKDPKTEKLAERAAQKTANSMATTFDEVAKACINAKRPGWKNAKHANQWTNTISTYASPVIGDLSISAIDVHAVLSVLEPIWETKNETATRVRQRIETILSWAKVKGYRTGDNPALWRGHLDQILPSIRKESHFAALPYKQMGSFMAALRAEKGIAAKALEFTILTVARTSMTTGAVWDEFDLDELVWTVPAERMKSGKEHLVPLSKRAATIVRHLRSMKTSDYVFPGGKPDTGLSNGAMASTLKRMGRRDITVHGFRSSFRDWASDKTRFFHEEKEHALAHQIKDKAEKAYSRSIMLEKRTPMMEAWSKYCSVEVVLNAPSPQVGVVKTTQNVNPKSPSKTAPKTSTKSSAKITSKPSAKAKPQAAARRAGIPKAKAKAKAKDQQARGGHSGHPRE